MPLACLARTLMVVLALAGTGAQAQSPNANPGGGIYTCLDNNGRRLTSDRPIAECTHKEQQLLNRDGSLRRVIPPTLTAEERAVVEAREKAAAEARAAQADAVRRDRNLLSRYPNEAAHNRAREAAADSTRLAMRAGELRMQELIAARKPLANEAEFYIGRQMPAKLKAQIDANEAAIEAQKNAAAAHEQEMARINRFYDAELERLRRLWAGAQPGSLGPMPPTPAAPRPVRPTAPNAPPASAQAASASAQR